MTTDLSNKVNLTIQNLIVKDRKLISLFQSLLSLVLALAKSSLVFHFAGSLGVSSGRLVGRRSCRLSILLVYCQRANLVLASTFLDVSFKDVKSISSACPGNFPNITLSVKFLPFYQLSLKVTSLALP